jgi:D-threo-aldose 1-dehydrogenase
VTDRYFVAKASRGFPTTGVLMNRKTVGSTGLELTELCFGGSAIGNLYREVSDDGAASAIDFAWDSGVRYFDTAPHYGAGLAEQRMGRSLGARPRDEFVLSTKVGRLLVANPSGEDNDPEASGFAVPRTHRRVWDFSRDGIRRSVEDSLTRLGLDRIDILFLHDPDDYWAQAVGEGFAALAELRAEGVIRAIGAGMKQSQMLTSFVRETDMDLIMLAGRYTLLDQSALDELLPLCVKQGVGIVNVGVFNSGLLSKPEPQPGMKYDYADAPPLLVDRAIKMAAICRRHGVLLPVAAIQFGTVHPAVVSTAIGARSAEQVRQNVEWLATPTPPELWAELKSEGLIRDDAPVPQH